MAFVTASVYDNYWVSHPIPRSDLQYSWLTASINASNPYPAKAETFGHAPEDGYVSSSAEGVVPAYNFVSASEVTDINGVSTSYAGYSTIIINGLSSSDNLLSASSFPSGYVGDLGGMSVDAETFNALMLHRNGPYQYPSWKQTRTGEHPIARKHRSTNIISVQDIPGRLPDTAVYESLKSTQPKKNEKPRREKPARIKALGFTHYNEPPVTSKFMPIQHSIKQKDAPSSHWYQYTHGNNKNMFSHVKLNNRLALDPSSVRTIYDEFFNVYNNADSEEEEFVGLIYKETVYPREINTFLGRTRQRENFTVSFWREDREDRQQFDAQNSQGYTIETSSMWMLDARDSFTTSNVIGGQTDGTGELQNGYTIFHTGAACTTAQLINQASLKLNGVDEYVELQPTQALFNWLNYPTSGTHTSASFSISMWFKTDSSDYTEMDNEWVLVSKVDTADFPLAQYYLAINNSNGHLIGTVGEDTVALRVDSGVSVVDNQWHHAVLASDGDQKHLWLDGIWKSTSTIVGTGYTASSNPIIGAWASGSQLLEDFFPGLIDEVSFWNTCLTASVSDSTASSGTIYDLYNDGCPTNLSQYFSASVLFSRGLNNTASTYIEIDDANTIDKTPLLSYYDMTTVGSASVSLWFRTPFQEDRNQVLWTTDAKDMILYVDGSGSVVTEFISSSVAGRLSTSEGYADNYWHHALFSANRVADGSDVFRLYVDGDLVDSSTNETFGTTGASTKMFIGAHPNFDPFTSSLGSGTIAPFTGFIDEVSLWNLVFTDAQALELYNSGSPTNLFEHSLYSVPSSTGSQQLLAWYRMGDDCRDQTYSATSNVYIHDHMSKTVASGTLDPYYHATASFLESVTSSAGIYHHGPEGLDAWIGFNYVDIIHGSDGYCVNEVTRNNPRGAGPIWISQVPYTNVGRAYPLAYLYASSSLLSTPLARYQTLLDTEDTPNTNCTKRFLPCPAGPIYARRTPEYNSVTGQELGYFAGDTLWEAGTQSGKSPFYDSYGHYQENMRGIGKDYTIVPEFRISEHMNYYVNEKSENFLAANSGFLTLEGASITSSANDDFCVTYSHSDFLKYFDVIEEDHKPFEKDKTLTLRCKALMKFLPYDGFYPADRTLQLATMFSQSYADNVNQFGGTTPYTFGTQPSWRTFIAPLFGPGVLYNSIKSGIAVDWPQMTSSFNITGGLGSCDSTKPFFPQPAASLNPDLDLRSLTSSARISSSFDTRIPFEALIEPENYLTVPLHDMEPHQSASLDSIAKWNGNGDSLYRLAMNNFLAESINLYLNNNNVTTLVSYPDNDPKHFNADASKVYKMRIVLRNSKLSRKKQILDSLPAIFFDWTSGSQLTNPTMTMYDRPSAFGPPTHAYGIHRQESYEPFTPPYYDGYSEVELTFKPTDTRRYYLNEIVSQLSASYYRIGTQFVTSPSPASGSRMHISASINFDVVTQLDSTIFDALTGRPKEVLQDENTPNIWSIQPKWETPILDFSNVSVTLPASGSGSVSRGMWHQYGSEPTAQQGIYLEVQDLDESELTNTALTGSLADLVGFPKTPIRLGTTGESFIVREAVVAVPYIEKNGERKFFNISKEQLAAAKLKLKMSVDREPDIEVGDTIVNMVDAMTKYIFPPEMDFLTFDTTSRTKEAKYSGTSGIEPFIMYIFEFEHKLTRKDLTDMWQNLPPDIGTSFKTNTVSIQHQMLEKEFFKFEDEIPDELRWKVFKVKQRAEKNYFNKVRKSIWHEKRQSFSRYGDTEGSRDHDPIYSYNWPYDFFSLVELVKMETDISIGSDDN